jgi:hypothetical protein
MDNCIELRVKDQECQGERKKIGSSVLKNESPLFSWKSCSSLSKGSDSMKCCVGYNTFKERQLKLTTKVKVAPAVALLDFRGFFILSPQSRFWTFIPVPKQSLQYYL